MTKNTMRAAICLLAFTAPLSALAIYPEQAIRIIVPYAAGGPTDAMARILQAPLQQALGTTVIVENVTGAGGALGAKQVLRAQADGYTLFLGNNGPSAVTPLLQKTAGFDPIRDFAPISTVAKAAMVVATSTSLPVTDMKSFITYAKTQPGRLNYASAGIGSLGHLGTELLIKQSGIQMTHIPYKGMAPTLNALIGNEVQFLLTTPTDAMFAHAKAGKIRLLGVTSNGPSTSAPGAEPIQNTVPDFVLYSWFALLAKAGTPEPVLQKLNTAINTVIQSDNVQKRFSALGVTAGGSTPKVVSDYIQEDTARWGAIIRDKNIQAE
ncbi:MAG: tripartite tricarboxylate transporter substrate binding protein [Burkholderiaceae bacterium]|nr:tripartite tricarboxylate transporter substrate binding protein [Burkholderiaceae bacterium]